MVPTAKPFNIDREDNFYIEPMAVANTVEEKKEIESKKR